MRFGAWAAAWGAVGWTAGLVLGRVAQVPWVAALLVAVGGLLLGALLALLRRPLTPALVLGAIGLGLLRVSFSPPLPTFSLPPGEQEISLEVVAGPPEQIGGLWRFTGRVEAVASGPARVGQRVLVYLTPPLKGGERRWPPVQRDDRLYLVGQIRPLPEGGAGRALAQQGVVGVLRSPEASLVERGRGLLAQVDRLRWRLALALRRSIHQPQAGLGQALLLGMRGDLLPEEWEAFRQAGTAHLLAVSGLHVALVLGILEALTFALVGRRPWAVGVPLAGLWGYATLVGLGPPVVRAALMGSMALGARTLGRPYAPLAALAVTVGVMAGLSPSLLGQASFQLSVAGMAGLVALGPRLHALLRLLTARWERDRAWLSAFVGSLTFSLGASLGAVPLAALTFERLPLFGVVATLFSLPFLLPALALSGVTALVGIAWEPLGSVVGWPAWAALAGLRLPSVWLGQVSGASLTVQNSGPLVWGFYGVLALVWVWPSLVEALPQWVGGRPLAFRWAFPVLAGAVALVWGAVLQVPPHRLTLEAFSDGSWVVQGPQGQVAVVTAGPDPRPVLRALGMHLPFWERRIALLVVSAPRGAPAAQEVLRRYQVERVVAAPSGEGVPGALPLQKGVSANLGEGIWLAVEEGTPSPVFRIQWGRIVWLLQGGQGEQKGEGAALVVYRERAQAGTYLVAHAAGQRWETPPGGALRITAEQERMWLQVRPRVP